MRTIAKATLSPEGLVLDDDDDDSFYEGSSTSKKSQSMQQAAFELGFWDEARVEVVGGDGGNGCLAFRREKSTPLGGPSGGNGGRGGSVVLVCDSSLNTLGVARRKTKYTGPSGSNGQGSNKHAPREKDLYVRVPPGTIVREFEPPRRVAGELVEDGETLVVARGGRGGRGNAAFKTDRLTAPRIAELGEAGARRVLLLELRLAADVGFVGKPNAGKSTLLAASTAAKPKIANYAFTTLVPNLGVWEPRDYRRSKNKVGKLATRAKRSRVGGDTKQARMRMRRRQKKFSSSLDGTPDFYATDDARAGAAGGVDDDFGEAQLSLALGIETTPSPPLVRREEKRDERGLVLADVPGLIEDAHAGAGMGDAFLKHVERCKVLLYVVDASGEDPVEDLKGIMNELAAYSETLASKETAVALTKCDVVKPSKDLIRAVQQVVKHGRVVAISAVTGNGVDDLMSRLRDFVDRDDRDPRRSTNRLVEAPQVDLDPPFPNSRENPDRSWTLLDGRINGIPGTWRIVSPRVEKIASMTNFEQPDAAARFGRQLQVLGVADELKDRGAQPGDLVMIGEDVDLEYDPLGFAPYAELAQFSSDLDDDDALFDDDDDDFPYYDDDDYSVAEGVGGGGVLEFVDEDDDEPRQ